MVAADLHGFWYLVNALLRLTLDGAFDLFLIAVAAGVLFKVRGAPRLSGLKWTAAALVLWAGTDLMAKVLFFLTGLFSVSATVGGWIGHGPVAVFLQGVDALGMATTALCVVVGVAGTVRVARHLEADLATHEAHPADDDDREDVEHTDPRVGLSMVAR